MSEWITDRLPTREDCVSSERTLYEDFVWTMVAGSVVSDNWYNIKAGIAWQPIVIERPKPYVAPEPWYYVKFLLDRWCVYCNVGGIHGIQADGLPTREAAERVAAIYNTAIYNEVMP